MRERGIEKGMRWRKWWRKIGINRQNIFSTKYIYIDIKSCFYINAIQNKEELLQIMRLSGIASIEKLIKKPVSENLKQV